MKFYKCAHCGNIIAYIHDSGVRVSCCGEEMKELLPNTTDAAGEKHVPVYEVKDGVVSVKVGSVEHPMTEAHLIEWILLRTDKGNQRKTLAPGAAPAAEFALLPGEQVEAVFAYCNLHGLWMA